MAIRVGMYDACVGGRHGGVAAMTPARKWWLTRGPSIRCPKCRTPIVTVIRARWSIRYAKKAERGEEQ